MPSFLSIAKILIAALIALAGFATAAEPPDVLGLWHGSVQTPAGTFALELTVSKDDHGKLVASLESLDQAPGQAIAATRIEQQNDALQLDFASLAASYAGHFDAASNTWVGNWQQGQSIALTWQRGPQPALPTIAGIDGTWRGTLNRNGTELHLILHIASTARGTRAKLDSPDMGLAGMDVTELTRHDSHLHLRVPLAGVVFEGTLSNDGSSLVGPWQRSGQPQVRMQFTRASESAPLSQQRPQAPQPPFDYAIESVHFANAAAAISLAGTLTLPRRAAPVPAAILISGSGPQDRDETLFGHKPFAVLADHLSRNGIAVLRFDDRGVAESGGDFASATLADFASDVRAALAFLRARAEIDPQAIGLIGHSQGGIVGPLVAMHDPSIAYLVLLAAPGTDMSELLLAQRRMAGVLQGRSEATLRAEEAALLPLYAAAAEAPDHATAQVQLRALLTPQRLRELGVDATQQSTLVAQFSGDWLRDVLHYDAGSTLAAIDVPILALNGSLDRQVPASSNLAAIRQATRGNPDITIAALPGLNHLFQTARSGAIAEYAEISETFAPSALRLISDWINARFKR